VSHFRIYIGENSANISETVFVDGGDTPTFKYMHLISICLMIE